MTEQTQDPVEPQVVAQKAGSVGSRMLSAAISSILGGLVGYFIGSRGDNNDRKLAQRSFAVVGAVFGALLSYFATKKQDVRSYDMTGAPTVLRQAHPEAVKRIAKSEEPQTEVAAESAEHQGMVQMDMEQAVAR